MQSKKSEDNGFSLSEALAKRTYVWYNGEYQTEITLDLCREKRDKHGNLFYRWR